MYTLKLHCNGLVNGRTIGLLEYTLGLDGKWYLATNTPMNFQTIGQARRYAEKHTDKSGPLTFIQHTSGRRSNVRK